MRDWEQASWAAGCIEADVIRRVGEAVAKRALSLTRTDDAILILAGKGHNGDDARAAQEHLAGRRVGLLNADSPQAELEKLDSILAQRPALVIDGLFGIGLNRPLDDAWQEFIKRVNRSKLAVLSVDVPSGLNADTGETFGAAIEASVTLTVGAPKIGMLNQVAWSFVGRLEVASDTGLIPCPHTSELQWTVTDDFRDHPPRRSVFSHKGDFGHVGILAGSLGWHGAAVLAARGAQRARPGLTSLVTHENAYLPVASQLQSVMVSEWSADFRIGDEQTAWLIGPGLAARQLPEEMKLLTRKTWRDATVPVIVDASAVDWLVHGPTQKGVTRVMTPHPGEAARLLRMTTQKLQSDRLSAVRELSRLHGDCWVVLKGHQTLIGRSSGPVFVNPTGNPHLAQGGSGDLLAGYMAGLVAQRPTTHHDDPLPVRFAVWEHGAAADRLQSVQRNWTVEDLSVEIGNIRKTGTH